ncbi:MAG: glycoside hydrolase family 13 protein [Alicyclobacillus sp.]|nr:glycoside hydrolase family 13 protein [Alicyclobacillus sp.]
MTEMIARTPPEIMMFHQPYEPFAYALDTHTARLVCQVARGQSRGVVVHFGDRYVPSLTDSLPMERVGADHQYDYFVTDVPVPTHRLKYAFAATYRGKQVWFGESGIAYAQQDAGVFQLAYLCRRDVFDVPDWVNRSVCYQIFPERFANGRPELTPAGAVPWDAAPTPYCMMGGDLPGIIDKLDYLQSLGVNLLYLTPIFAAGSNHKYDTFDYLQIDPQFGTKEDLANLVQQAHARGIRVLLDAVFNHSGYEFGPFKDVREKGRASRYFDWFFIDGDKVDGTDVNYETFATKLRYMPKLNVANPEVEQFLLDVATYWIRECDIDGWRLDVANEIDHVFWRKFRAAVKAAKPDALIIGEVWHNSLPWLRGDQFDGVMNYVFRELCHGFFIQRKLTGDVFAAGITRLQHMYPGPANRAMFNLLGSHDTARVLTLANGDATAVQLATVFQFTYPGIPMVYYGDEVGMEGGPDPDCRRGMVWDPAQQNASLRDTVTALANLKQTEPALAHDALRFVHSTKHAVEFVRESADGSETLYVAINLGARSVRTHAGEGKLMFSTRANAVDGGLLAGRSAAIWRVDGKRAD